MAFLVLYFVLAFASQQVLGQAETVNTNVPQYNGENNFFVTFDFESLAPTCCPGPLPYCGDGKCNRTETCFTCPQDCKCMYCGDGLCLATDNETCTSCPSDCGSCPTTSVCGDGVCTAQREACGNCPIDCGVCVVCGDGVCDFSENCDSCPLDCGGACPSGAIVGTVVDILTNLPIVGALVQTLNVRPGNEFYISTNSYGNFFFPLIPVQIVQLQATDPNYGLATVTVQVPLNGIVNVTIYMAPALPTGSWKVRLTWGATPSDLDLTMFGDWAAPYLNGVVDWETPNKTLATPYAFLSSDVTNGFGPEYITINRFGTPRQNVEFWVRDYTEARVNVTQSFIGSNARVFVWTGILGIQGDWTINSTTLTGKETWWHVFDITPSGQAVAVNQFFSNVAAAPCSWAAYCPYLPIDLFQR